MNPEIEMRLVALETKIDKIYALVEKTRKYFMWTLILSVLFVVVPAIGLAFALPAFLSNYLGNIQSVTNILP